MLRRSRCVLIFFKHFREIENELIFKERGPLYFRGLWLDVAVTALVLFFYLDNWVKVTTHTYGWQPIAFVNIPFFFLFFFHFTYSRWTSSLPSCLWPQRIFPSLPGSRLTIFLSRCKFSTLTTRQPMVEFYLLTFPRFPLRKKEHKSYLVRIELTTSVLADVQLTY